MRPKKRILLVGEDAVAMSCLRLALKVWGYAVQTAATRNAALDAVRERRPELLVIVWPMAGASGLIAKVAKLPMRTMALCGGETRPEDCQADAALLKAPMSIMREMVAQLTVRRHGPAPTKKPTVRLRFDVGSLGSVAYPEAQAAPARDVA